MLIGGYFVYSPNLDSTPPDTGCDRRYTEGAFELCFPEGDFSVVQADAAAMRKEHPEVYPNALGRWFVVRGSEQVQDDPNAVPLARLDLLAVNTAYQALNQPDGIISVIPSAWDDRVKEVDIGGDQWLVVEGRNTWMKEYAGKAVMVVTGFDSSGESDFTEWFPKISR